MLLVGWRVPDSGLIETSPRLQVHPVLPLQAGRCPHLQLQLGQLEQLGPHPALQDQLQRGPRCFGDRWEGSQRQAREAEPQLVWWWGMVPQARPLPSASLVPTPG